jgi:type I restriction enzyme S subunit
MTVWQTRRIGDLGRVVTGKTPPASQPDMFTGAIPFLTPTDMEDDLRLVATGRSVSSAWDAKRRALLPAASVCVVCIGATIGKICMTVKPTHTNQQINSIIVDMDRFDPHFVYYALRLKVGELKARAAGAATPILNKSAFSDVTLKFPELSTQRRIAAILGAYDDLIETNRRRVMLLENMARNLFDEWFVRFRFPGHSDAPIVETHEGALPAGWTWSTAAGVLDFDPQTRVAKEGEKPFVPMGHLDTVSSVISPHGWREGNSGAKFRTGDVLFARITPCLENGKTGLVRDLPGGVGFGSTEFIVMRGARAGSAFAYCLARSEPFRANAVTGMSGASGRQRARTDSVSAFMLPTPPGSELFDQFETAAAPMFEAVGHYAKANSTLAASRDHLLPRLISGQLSVDAAATDLQDAA